MQLVLKVVLTVRACCRYAMLERQLSTGVIKDNTKPWGVGAQATMNQTFGDPKDGFPSKPIPMTERALFLEQMRAIFAHRQRFGWRRSTSIHYIR